MQTVFGKRNSALLWLCVAVWLLLAGGTSSAFAASRYAAPAPRGSGDCSSPGNACQLQSAVAIAGSGDDVYVLGNFGQYQLGPTGIAPGSAKVLHFHGFNGRPQIFSTSTGGTMALTAPSSSVDGLYVENDGGGEALNLAPPGGGALTASNVIAAQPAGDRACYLGGGVTLLSSVCWQSNGAGGFSAAETTGTNTLRNDTLWAEGPGAVALRCYGTGGTSGGDALVNTIARVTGPGASDLAANATPPATATIYATHSNFASTRAEGDPGLDRFSFDGSDQSAFPLLLNPAAGDFHEAAGSPTVDAGLTDAANGPIDFDGNPRTLIVTYRFAYGTTSSWGARTPNHAVVVTDIGADERAKAPGVSTQPAIRVSGNTAVVRGMLNPNGAPHAQPVSAQITGLRPHTVYYFELLAGSAGGASTTTLAHFTTSGPAAPKCTLGRVDHSSRPLKIAVKCGQAAKVKLTGALTETVNGKKKVFKLGPVSATVRAGVSRTLSLKLPGAAVTGAGASASKAAAVTLAATNANGTSRKILVVRRV